MINYSLLYFKSMILWNFDLLWIKLWYYGETYGNIPKTLELRFTKEKKHGRLPKAVIYNEKTMVIYQYN